MAFTRAELTERLEALDAKLPKLRADYPNDDDFWCAFAGEADFATEGAGAEDFDWVNAEVDGLLRKHGIEVPKDQAPGDC